MADVYKRQVLGQRVFPVVDHYHRRKRRRSRDISVFIREPQTPSYKTYFRPPIDEVVKIRCIRSCWDKQNDGISAVCFFERLLHPFANLPAIRRVAKDSAAAIPTLRESVHFRRVEQSTFCCFVRCRGVEHKTKLAIQFIKKVLRRAPAHVFGR